MTLNERIEKALAGYLPGKDCLEKRLIDSMEYSLLAGGKRIRPLLVLEFCQLCGGNIEDAMPFACAVEMIHTYSLIHDDLPCMDNDDFRRGKPSNHKVYGEDTALLAGDALQALAFKTATSNITKENAYNTARAVNNLAEYCGANGMVGGQIIDLENEGKSSGIDILKEMDRKKTAAIIKSACEMGCIVAGADDEDIKRARVFGESIGLAFQIQDDILDVTSDIETLGKPIGSDEKNHKVTYVRLNGLEQSKKDVEALSEEALTILSSFDQRNEFLEDLVRALITREK